MSSFPLADKTIDALANRIGTRFGGTAAENQAARAIASIFEEVGLEVSMQEYRFIGWEPEGDTQFTISEHPDLSIEAAPMLYSAASPPQGIRGQLKEAGKAILIPDVFELDTFSLFDEQGREQAKIFVANDRAIPLQNARPMYRLPQIVIGKEDAKTLSTLLSENASVEATITVGGRIVPDAVSYNVIGRLRRTEEASHSIVCAHYDTTIGTPGAYDNASGVAGLVELAARLMQEPIDINIDFIAFACEEGGFFGSKYFVNSLLDSDQLDSVTSVINFDQISAGDFLWVWTGPESFAEEVSKVLRKEGVTDRYEVRIDPPKPGADDYPFAEQGIPTVSFIFWVPPYYHTAEDTPDKIDWEKLRTCVDAAEQLVRGEEART